jgi:ABC-type multidrug transport system fused ATPase/permease subunit
MKSQQSPTVRQTLHVLLHGQRRKVAVLAFSSLTGGFAEAMFLVIMTRAAFAITSGKDEMGLLANRTVPVSIAMLLSLGLVVLRIILAVASNWIAASIATDVAFVLRRRLASAFLFSSWGMQQSASGGRLQELVMTYAGQAVNVVAAYATGLVAACSVGAMLLFAIGVDPVGSIVAVLAVGCLGAVLGPLRGRLQILARKANDDGMQLATAASEVSGLGMAVHVFDVRTQVLGVIDAKLHQTLGSSRRLSLLRGLVPAIYSGLAYLVLIGAVTLASISNTAKLTSLGAVMLVMLRSLAYGQQVQVASSTLHSSMPAAVEVFAEVERYEAARFEQDGEPVEHVGTLTFEAVGFRYVDDQPVFEQLSFTVERGEMIGIVGPSGSGKTSLVQLLLGLREPGAGRVLADGRDIRRLRHADWARAVSFVSQAPALVRGTISENIRFYRSDISDAQIQRAAELAGLDEEISGFPLGYDHPVGDRGGNLSGGQQQRLCIARALAGDPEVLILDEPTSALDAQSEAIIKETLEGLRHHKTVIVIAHRLSTVEQCDRIMVIQNGTITGFDTPEALRASSGFYSEAVRLSGLA